MQFFPTTDEDFQYFRLRRYTGSINDMHFSAMGDLGYTGTLDDRIHAYLVDTHGSFHEAMRDLRNGTSVFDLVIELVANGTFDTDISGWTHVPHGTGAVSWSSGAMSLDAVDVSNRAKVWTPVSTEAGRQYSLTFTTTAGISHFNLGTTPGGYQVAANSNIAPGTYSQAFTAISTTTYLYHETWVAGGTLDNVSVQEVF